MTVLRDTARQIVERLQQAGFEAYYAGGCVRDMLRGTEPADYDIATSAHPEQVMDLFEKTVPVGVSFGVVIVIEENLPFEVATFRSEGAYTDGRHPDEVVFTSPQEDVQRRDFTINGLLYDPLTDRVLDWVGGERDLHAHLIRTIGDPHERFAEDKLRMLRAVRFAVRFDFRLDPATRQAIQEMACQVGVVSAERIRDELVKILAGPRAGGGLSLLQELGLLRPILPEVEAMVGVPQPPEFHPEGDVFVHTCLALDHLDRRTPVLVMATLLHDVGKPPTYQVADRIRFNGHSSVGAEMAAGICRRLRFSREEVQEVITLIHDHLRLVDLPNMRLSRQKRFIRESYFPDLLHLVRADSLACHGNLGPWELGHEKLQEFSKPEALRPPRLITGEDLKHLGLRPGPLFRTILQDVEDQQLEDGISTREQALAYVKQKYLPPPTPPPPAPTINP